VISSDTPLGKSLNFSMERGGRGYCN